MSIFLAVSFPKSQKTGSTVSKKKIFSSLKFSHGLNIISTCTPLSFSKSQFLLMNGTVKGKGRQTDGRSSPHFPV